MHATYPRLLLHYTKKKRIQYNLKKIVQRYYHSNGSNDNNKTTILPFSISARIRIRSPKTADETDSSFADAG